MAAALPALLAVFFAACSNTQYPNSVFTRFTENNRDVGHLFNILFYLGTFVFIFVEAILLYTIWKYRRKSENDRPKHVHGNTTLEILWTAIPALILAFIAVPTVRTIFKSQAKATADAVVVQVIGHQWWWEFRYPQYTAQGNGKLDTLTTANELYLPLGRKVSFTLTSRDVIHSFSIPQLAGKRDLMANRVNFLWFTPDSTTENTWNGFCAEFCGASHANMHFKVMTVSPANFESWTAHQLSRAAFGAVALAPAAPTAAAPDSAPARQSVGASQTPGSQLTVAPTNTPATAAAAVPAGTSPMAGHDMSAMGATPVQQAGFIAVDRTKIPAHSVPTTPVPAGLAYNESLKGDPQRGMEFLSKMGGGCVGCHMINGNPVMMGTIGPNLTHVGSRSTIAGGIFPNDTKHLTLWLKNARKMKPGVLMPTLGAGEYDPVTKAYIPKTGLSDQQIADIVAYLQALK
jgi:cytochrome c oxidase subunit 2